MNDKIIVSICNCGNEISRVVDTQKLKEFATSIEGVSEVHVVKHLCNPQSLKRLKRVLIDGKADRVVIVACSPQLHIKTFRRVLEDAGINPFKLEMVNVREHCSWVHENKENATKKAESLVAGAIEKVKFADEIEPKETKITKSVLVIGAGVSGTNTALELIKKGIKTYLVEKEPWIGGVSAKVGIAFPTNDCAYCIGARSDLGGVRKCFYRANLTHYPNLDIITNAEVKEISGSVGNFKVVVEETPTFVNEECISCGMCEEVCPIEVDDEFNQNLSKRKAIYKQFEAVPNKYAVDFDNCIVCKKCVEVCPEDAIDFLQRGKKHVIDVGAIVVATGIKEFDASKTTEYGYNKYKEVITQLDLARYLDPAGPTKGELVINDNIPKTITMIQCVGSRDDQYNRYCSRLCCMMALKHARLIKTRYPDVDVNICYIDIRTTGVEGYEEWYSICRELGVNFIRGKPSDVLEKDGKLIVRTENLLLGKHMEIESDLVVLSAGMEASDGTKKIAGVLDIQLSEDNFISTIDPKVRASTTDRWGVFVTGGARGPTDIPESILQANAAASPVGTIMSKDKIVDYRIYPKINLDACDGCGVCVEKCKFGAISVNMEKEKKDRKAQVSRDMCRGCGGCVANCPNNAMQLLGYTDDQITVQLSGILSNGLDEKIIGFICYECGYASSDLAGAERFNYPENIHLVTLPCLGRISAIHILKAFELGAKGVCLIGCMPGRCQYNPENTAKDNVELAKSILESIDGELSEKIQLYNFCGAKSHDFARSMNEFTKRVLGE